jgi:hypothetical protein
VAEMMVMIYSRFLDSEVLGAPLPLIGFILGYTVTDGEVVIFFSM